MVAEQSRAEDSKEEEVEDAERSQHEEVVARRAEAEGREAESRPAAQAPCPVVLLVKDLSRPSSSLPFSNSLGKLLPSLRLLSPRSFFPTPTHKRISCDLRMELKQRDQIRDPLTITFIAGYLITCVVQLVESFISVKTWPCWGRQKMNYLIVTHTQGTYSGHGHGPGSLTKSLLTIYINVNSQKIIFYLFIYIETTQIDYAHIFMYM